jgi:hypothetical protein
VPNYVLYENYSPLKCDAMSIGKVTNGKNLLPPYARKKDYPDDGHSWHRATILNGVRCQTTVILKTTIK